MTQAGLTYYIDPVTHRICSTIDGKESLLQSVYKALGTEKYGYLIYDWLYGLDMEPFIGQDLEYIRTHVETYITDCLMQDDRILSITNLTVEQQSVDSCLATFDIVSTEGTIERVTKDFNYG